MKIQTLFDVVTAAHLARYVEGEFKQFGGIMFIAPPANLKSTIIDILKQFPAVQVCSDVNVQSLIAMRSLMASGALTTLAFPELEKIYQRNPSTAANIEGTLKAMVEEGFSLASFQAENVGLNLPLARCLLIGALTEPLWIRKYREWSENGFKRRFMWCQFHLKDSSILIRSIHAWRKLRLATDSRLLFIPRYGYEIPYTVTPEESERLETMLASQLEYQTPLVLLKKILCVLRWRYPDSTRAWEIVSDFGECLAPGGAELEVSEQIEAGGVPVSEDSGDLIAAAPNGREPIKVPEFRYSPGYQPKSFVPPTKAAKKQAKRKDVQ